MRIRTRDGLFPDAANGTMADIDPDGFRLWCDVHGFPRGEVWRTRKEVSQRERARLLALCAEFDLVATN